jgi:2-polyprenyl-6-methoxyphenol hydroxylase-like FAD-dependent oxidoreductase
MPKVVIIGAGLSGLCLAQGLVGAGVEVCLFERDEGVRSRGQGYRLTIDQAGSLALRQSLPAPVYEFVRATSGKPGGAFVFADEAARELHRMVFDFRASDARGDITGQVDRQTLRQALLSGIEKHVHFGKTFAGYEERPDEVIAQFADGSSARGSILIGADGTNSLVRRQRLPGLEPRDTDIRAVFGRTRLAALAPNIRNGFLLQGGVMMLGPRGRLFFCANMQFREQPDLAGARLAVPGEFRRTDDYAMWAVCLRRSALTAEESDAENGAALQRIARAAMTGFPDDCSALIENGDSSDTILVPIRVMPSLKPWASNRITLIGDAIHTMPPFGAHGANTALRDARTLANQLIKGCQGIEQSVAAIATYESAMRHYSGAAVRAARRMMAMATADFPGKRVIFRLALRAASRFASSRH